MHSWEFDERSLLIDAEDADCAAFVERPKLLLDGPPGEFGCIGNLLDGVTVSWPWSQRRIWGITANLNGNARERFPGYLLNRDQRRGNGLSFSRYRLNWVIATTDNWNSQVELIKPRGNDP
jgi:hypothetical protein